MNETSENVEKDDLFENEGSQAEETQAVAEIPNEEIAKLKSELEEQKDKYVRLFAEFDNYRRRTSKESIELRQTAGIEVITSLLDVLDDMDRAEIQLQDSDADQNTKDGITLVFNKFRKDFTV